LDVVDPLVEILQDKSLGETIRGTAAVRLGQIGDPRAAGALAEAAKDDSLEVSQAAMEALEELERFST
jgi:HEAT repeat protein